MSKAVKEKIDELFEAVKDLKSFDEIKPHCDRFNEWIESKYENTSSRGTVLSRDKFYTKLRSIPLKQGENAGEISKHDKNGNVIEHKLEHYAIILCGLSKKDWRERNTTDRVVQRLGNDNEIDPDVYLEVTGELLASHDPHELAVGLIAATGRRPHEILARAKFTEIEGQAYQVLFEGQGKKRGDKPIFPVPVLYPAQYVIECLARLRKEPSTQALIREIAKDFPRDISAQNRSLDSCRNGSLNRVVRARFGDKGDSDPILAFRHGEEQDNCKALRAAYAALIAHRDCGSSIGARIIYCARALGHITSKNPSDDELKKLATTISYADYFCNKSVVFPPMPESKKNTQKASKVGINEGDLNRINQLKNIWELPNQQSVLSRLIENHEKAVELSKQVQELQIKNAELIKEKEEMTNKLSANAETSEHQESSEPSGIESKIEKIIEEKLSQALAKIGIPPIDTVSDRAPKTQSDNETDWNEVLDPDLWGNKKRGAAEEKVRRSFVAIAAHNDNQSTKPEDKLAVTNQALRELSGVNGLIVGDWLKGHTGEVIRHNSEHGLSNPKDPEKLETYYNKRHGSERISQILRSINQQYLNGASPVGLAAP